MTIGSTQIRHTQVLVIGAGAAGISAAIAAGRSGARTLLVERSGFLGGISATLPWLGFHDQRYMQVVKGIAVEAVGRLQELGGAGPITLDPKCGSLVSIHSHYWKAVAFSMLKEAQVDVMLHALFVDTIREGDRITGVVVETKSGRISIHADVVIDCSGDGDVAARGGVEWHKGRTGDGLVQAPTLVFRLGGVDDDRFREACKDPDEQYREWLTPYPELFEQMTRKLDEVDTWVLGGFAKLVARAREEGFAEFPQTRIVGVKTFTPQSPHEISVVMSRVLGLDPTDVDSVSDAYARVYEQVLELVRFFQKYVPGCENAYLIEIAPMLGIRESRRIAGDYQLSADDLTSGARHDDDVAMGAYHIDIHRPSGSWVQSTNVKAYGIPFRSLVAAGVDGLLMAGKCISASHEAIGSTRVIPICMSEGQAVGTAAGMAVKAGRAVRDLDIAQLREELTRAGAEVGLTLEAPDPDAIAGWPLLPFRDAETSGEADLVSAEPGAWVSRK